MNHSAVMGQSWRLVWRRKSLLGLGLLSAVATVVGAIALYAALIGLFLASPDLIARFMGLPDGAFEPWPFSRGWLALTVVGLIVWLALWLVGLAARGGLIAAVDDLESGEPPAGGAFGRGWRRVLPLAGMSFVLWLPYLIIVILTQAAVLATMPDFILAGEQEFFDAMMSTYLLSCGFSCVNLIVSLFLQFIYPFAYRGVVLRGMGVRASIGHGWRVLRSNFGDILPLALLFGVVMIVLLAVWYGAFFALYFVLIFGIVIDPSGPSPALIGIVIAAVLLFLLVSLFVFAILTAWRSAAFTIGYRRWAVDKPTVEAAPVAIA
jgi:hypothetical protein